ncbi:MAG: hypothetical protein ACKKMW_02230 [Candidatus Nealsonbacteria bacterium]
MKMKYWLIRLFLRLWTRKIKIVNRGKSPIQPQSHQKYYSYFSYESISENMLKSLIRAYQSVFSEPPWEETWEEILVKEKIENEITGKPVLTIMGGNFENPVTGFSWGSLIDTDSVAERIKSGLLTKAESVDEQKVQSIENFLKKRSDKILFYDEFAILSQFRGGVDQIRFLFRPGLEMAFEHGVKQTIFWSTPESKIVPLAIFMGFRPISTIMISGKKVIFLYNSDFRSVLKIAQSMPAKKIKKIMSLFS